MARKSTSRSISAAGTGDEGTLVVGVIRGAHGVRGELRVAPDTDNPDRLRPGRRVIVDGLGEREIISARGGGERVILTLAGVADQVAAKALAGRALRVAIHEARREAKGYLWADLVGMAVVDESGAAVGVLEEVLRPGGGDVFVVRRADGSELLLPAIGEVILDVDADARRMTVRPQEEA